jgi:hypothetical protein
MEKYKVDASEQESYGGSLATIARLMLLPAWIVYMGTRSYTENYLSECRVRLRMQGCGRFLRKSGARVRIEEYPGTLIIENPTISWDYTRAWWVPEDVLSNSPFVLPTKEDYRNAALEMRCEDWDLWCYQNYTCPDHGRAFLLRVWNGAAFGTAFSKEFPEMAIVHNWTGFVKMRL